MTKYLFKRLALMIPLFLGITAMTFAVTQLAPGDPTDQATQLNPKISQEAKLKLRELYGLDRPIYERYARWVWSAARMDFGRSFRDGEPVLEKIASRIPVTLAINLTGLLLTVLLAVVIGVIGAARQGTWIDQALTFVVFVAFAMPTFVLALAGMAFFGIRLHWFPISGVTSLDHELMSGWGQLVDVARHLTLPVLVSVLAYFSGLARYMRAGMIEVFRQDYIKTAWSKGLSPRAVLFGHALRNALLPLITILGLSVPAVLGGSVILETVFAIPGMGKLMMDSVMARDLPVYMALLTISALLTLIGNLLADLAYRWADPRIRHE
jgi:peptide/nickel transport system permease protein